MSAPMTDLALASHPLYGRLRTVTDVRRFMACHVMAVWDFMSLVKSLQAVLAPTAVPWMPPVGGDPELRRFINALVLEEESDWADPQGLTHGSHFELYRRAMQEIGADPAPMDRFLVEVRRVGIDAALLNGEMPAAGRRFVRSTFDVIATAKPHVMAAALAHGREQVIPPMFRAVLAEIGVGEEVAPTLHFYLRRHIALDEDFHAPMALRMVEHLCGSDPQRWAEAEVAATDALQARVRFWDEIAVYVDDKGARV
ncbi:MAG: DUF3050 domain-containing protein [Leptothrix ochracea]